MEFKSGFISVVGSPNAGKSTLVNALVGEKVSIVTPKAQTTRNTIRGVMNGDRFQMVFLDTPGLITPRDRMQRGMMRTVTEASRDADAVLFMVDGKIGLRTRDAEALRRLNSKGAPVVVAINKVDCARPAMIEAIGQRLGETGFTGPVLKISALNGEGLSDLVDVLKGMLLPGPEYFPPDMYTDAPRVFMAAEIIREKALMCLDEEVPHGIGVEIEKCALRENRPLYDIDAALYCEKQSHKGIIIGARGARIKQIGASARPELEELFECQVNLTLFVKVREDWRNSPSALKTLGYE